jgi:hypothetical protein
LIFLPEADCFVLSPVEVSFGFRVAEEGAEVRGVGLVGQLDQEAFGELERARKLTVNLPNAILPNFYKKLYFVQICVLTFK